MSLIADTQGQLPYWAVIFSNLRTENIDEYEHTADRMMELAAQQPGFLGVESVRNGLGITISYWKDEQSIRAWRLHAEHRQAQDNGRNRWYSEYCTRVCKVEREVRYNAAEHKDNDEA